MTRFLGVSLSLTLASFLRLAPAQDEDAPMTALELFQAGHGAYRERDFEKAQELFQQFLEGYGDSEETQKAVKAVRPLLAICLIRTRRFGEAREMIDAVLKGGNLARTMRLELVFWQGVCQLQAADHAKARAAFGAYYKEAPSSDPRRMEAAILFGTSYILEEQYAEAIAFFEERIDALESSSPEVSARMMTLQLHAMLRADRLDEGLALILRAAERFDRFVQIIALQSLILDLGSRLLEEGRYYDAIRCFHYVWPREQLIKLQTSRRDRLEKRIRSLKARGQADALVFQLDGILTRINREMAHFSKVTNYDAAARMRLASAYLGLQRYRQAALIMEEMLARMEPNEIVEGASVNLVQCWIQVERWDRAAQAADLYLERFGAQAPNASTILFMRGQACQGAQRYEEALTVFEQCLKRYPTGPMTPNASLMRGICSLQLERYEKASAFLRDVPVAFPNHPQLAESASYWEGMAHSFALEHDRCRQLMQQHLKAFPQGFYEDAAAFRIAFSEYALADYQSAIASFLAFQKAHSESPYIDEARLLLGDAYLARGQLDEGMASYAAISPQSTRFYQDGYFKTGKALRLSERFQEMATHFQAFVQNHPSASRLPEALHWLAWLKQREGDLQGARQMYWEAVDTYGDEADMPAVLDLIRGLEKLYLGPQRPTLISAWEQRRQLALKKVQTTLAVRCLWAQAMAMRPARPVQAAIVLAEAAPELEPEIHSATLLVDCADALHHLAFHTEAAALYRQIVKWHPSALERDRADFGLGRESMRLGEYAKALEHLERVERRQSGTLELGKILLAKATCYDQLGDRKLALAALEALLSEKSVSSEQKAEALVRSGHLLAAEDELEKALVYYERVYLVYGRYAPLVATAYWSRGQSLEKLGHKEKAQELYREFVSRRELQQYPEYAKAQERVIP